MKTSILLLLISLPFHLIAQQPELGINLENYTYPFQEKYHNLFSQGQKLSMAYLYEKAGKSNGITIVLFHGKNFNGAYWANTMERLLRDGYDVLAPDQIGFGKSTKPEYYHYTFHQLAENTRGLIDSLNIDNAILLGHSMGGMLATRFALMFPEKVSKLILENPIGLEDWKLKVPYKTIDEWYQNELGKSKEGLKNYMLKNYFDNEWKKEYDNLVYLNTAFLASPDYPRLAWNSALTYDMIFTQPVYYEFKNLKVPTVLIIGLRDRTALRKNEVETNIAETMGNYPEISKEVTNLIPDAELIPLEGIGHIPHIEDFNLFIEKLLEAIKKQI
ncbi:alpha/beta hydrolase [soil metagenome]